MGVLNLTPDSFSDGGRYFRDNSLDLDRLRRAAAGMVDAGAALLDLGGESTRPGAQPVSVQEELDRVLPAVEILAGEVDAIVSLDTSTPQVMREGAALGAGLLNDVRALRRPGALQAASELGLPVCLMHMQGAPDTMQQAPHYEDVLGDVAAFLEQRRRACVAAGIPRQRILFDPGFGFGKTASHNLQLLAGLPRLAALAPLLVGLSRKSLIATLTGRCVDQRLAGSLALALLAAQRGARILRVHDVGETVDVLRILQAVEEAV